LFDTLKYYSRQNVVIGRNNERKKEESKKMKGEVRRKTKRTERSDRGNRKIEAGRNNISSLQAML
jgi:predicted RNase H-like nuclease (RuvC/YqgF family)